MSHFGGASDYKLNRNLSLKDLMAFCCEDRQCFCDFHVLCPNKIVQPLSSSSSSPVSKHEPGDHYRGVDSHADLMRIISQRVPDCVVTGVVGTWL